MVGVCGVMCVLWCVAAYSVARCGVCMVHVRCMRGVVQWCMPDVRVVRMACAECSVCVVCLCKAWCSVIHVRGAWNDVECRLRCMRGVVLCALGRARARDFHAYTCPYMKPL